MWSTRRGLFYAETLQERGSLYVNIYIFPYSFFPEWAFFTNNLEKQFDR